VFESLIPSRSVEEIVSGIVPVRLGSATYALPELSMAGTDAWAASIDGRLAGLLGAVDRLDSGGTIAQLFLVAKQFDAELLDTLIAYDTTGVLPERDELRANATHTQVLFAVMGVWATTSSPLAAAVLSIVRALPEIPTGTQSAPISGLLETLGLTYADSESGSPTESSTAESPTPRTDSTTSSNGRSKRSASARSSRTTRTPRASGAATPHARRPAA
jgi:hypothetical protein